MIRNFQKQISSVPIGVDLRFWPDVIKLGIIGEAAIFERENVSAPNVLLTPPQSLLIH